MYIWVYFVFVQNWWRMMLLLLIHEWFHDYLLLMLLWGVLLMNWCHGFSWLWIGDVNWVVVESFGETLLDCWFMLKWCFDFKFCVTLSAFSYTYTCKQLLEWVWTYGRSKFGFLGEKGLEPVTFFDRTDDWSHKHAASEL